ncbi:MAG: DNA polymerase III subunit delta [Candidatus Moranbacteria bacterium]|nr:DNA polymerase III subunit delta [Candidatus Moranbacteria bacterium]
MLYLFYGENSYLLSRKKLDIESRGKKAGVEFNRFDASLDLDEFLIKQSIASDGLFGVKKSIVFCDFISSLPDSKIDFLLALIKENSEYVIEDNNLNLYFFESKPKKNSRIYRFLSKKAAEKKEFKLLKGTKLLKFLENEVQTLGIKIGVADLRYLVYILNEDLWRIINNLKKLAAFKAGKQIEKKDIDKLVEPVFANNIFKTIEAIGRGDKRTALNLIKKHIQEGDHELYLLSMIVYQFRILIKIDSALRSGLDSASLSKKLKLHPFVVKKNGVFLRGFSQNKLAVVYKKLAEIDYSVKKGNLAPRQAIELFVAFA